jgi:pimeloyl-ACP methyl ester carboxylesterase
VRRLIEHLGVEQIVFVGESFGGIIGLQFAHAYPQHTRALVLCNTPCRLPTANCDNVSRLEGIRMRRSPAGSPTGPPPPSTCVWTPASPRPD